MSIQRQLYDLAGRDPELRFSPYCWRSKFALAHKGLGVESVPWRMHEAGRLAFSGQAKVPVLVDGTRSVYDSWTIATYLEDTYPDAPSLFGAPAAIPVTRVINAWADSFLHGLIAPIIVLDVHNCLHAADQAYFRATREARFKTTLEALTADRVMHLKRLSGALEPLRTVLAAQQWLAGESPGYADYIIAGSLQWARIFLGDKLLDTTDPVARWFDAVLDLHHGLGRGAKLQDGVR